MPDLITECVNEWSGSVKTYEAALSYIIEQLEGNIDVSCRITSRVKSDIGFTQKTVLFVEQGKIKSKKDIYHKISDLIAVRVMTYLESDRETIVKVIQELFAPAFPEKKRG